MKFCAAAILAFGVAPAYSFSYLESLSGAAPVTSTVDIAPPVPVPAEEAPFFFTNGATEEPADSPAFFFTSGSTDVPASTSSGSYLENLGGENVAALAAPASGTDGTSYLDVLGSGATSVSGPGMANYLDALPQNSAYGGGPGISSYASSLNQAASDFIGSVPPSAPEAAPVAVAPSNSVMPSAPNSGDYLDALASGVSTTSGAGITTYLDALPRSATLSGGMGISTYSSNLVSANVVSGPGMTTYTDVIGGGLASFTQSFSPFRKDTDSPAFAIGSVTGTFDFTFEADAEMIDKMKAAGDGSVTITGKLTSFNY